MYSTYVSFVLGCMVATGAARSIVAKLFFQLGFEAPLFLTLLYLGGQALSLVPYNIWVYFCNSGISGEEESCNSEEEETGKSSTVDVNDRSKRHIDVSVSDTTTRTQRLRRSVEKSSRIFAQSVFTDAQELQLESEDEEEASHQRYSTQSTPKLTTNEGMCKARSAPCHLSGITRPTISDDESGSNGIIKDEEKVEEGECNTNNIGESIKNQSAAPNNKSANSSLNKSVSVHGLPSESRTEKLISRIPWYLKPIIPAFFNLLNSCMRWTSLLFVAASIAEMLISGMELVLSVLAARCVRGRRITCVRWVGVGIVTLGIILVGIFDTRNANIASQGDDSANTDGQESTVIMRDQVIGILLILGQSIMSVFQDIAEEVFMHEAAFPPALLVGMEGSFGLIIALILYFPLAPLFGEQPSTVLEDLQSNSKIVGLSIGWALLVTVTGVFNIAATGVTSSMTRNVWKNFRTALIWIVSLIIFYATGNPELGEEWFIPGSFYILIGFIVMLCGVYVYYGKSSKA